MSNEQKYVKDKDLSDKVTQTKVSHGKIETVIRAREAKTKEELDLELQRLNVLNEIDKSTVGEEFALPSELKQWQQLILIIGKLSLKSSKEVLLACKKLKYTGYNSDRRIVKILTGDKRDFFRFDKEKGWVLTNKGQNEFSRLKQFV